MDVDPTTAAVLGAVAALVAVAAVTVAWRVSQRPSRSQSSDLVPAIEPGVAQVLSVLRSCAVVVDEEDRVLKASAPAYLLDLVHERRIVAPELVEMVHAVRRDGQIQDRELVVHPGRGTARRHVHARVAPLDSHLVVVLAEDRTRERQVEALRKNFVANVSHELKTPVGAINLLAETVRQAADDPEAVRHFSDRMQAEGTRLTRLVQQIIELSRVQDDTVLASPSVVSVDDVITQAVGRVRVDAEAKNVTVTVVGSQGCRVRGDTDQLVVAVGNLVDNAVTHSPADAEVTVDVTPSDSSATSATVTIAVSDRGEGVPAKEQQRIFQRFYRTDPARARDTGGNGLGLSIVKHVAAVHSGDVSVTSVEGQGATFALTLPAAAPAAEAGAGTGKVAPITSAHPQAPGRSR